MTQGRLESERERDRERERDIQCCLVERMLKPAEPAWSFVNR